MKRAVVTDAARGIGELVAEAMRAVGVGVHSMGQRPSESHAQEAEAWLEVCREFEPDALFVSHLRIRGGGLSRSAVQTAEAIFAAAARCPSLQKIVLLSSGQVYGSRDDMPTFAGEATPSDTKGATARALGDVEAAAFRFARTRPDTALTVLRPTEVLGSLPHGLLADHVASSGAFVTAELGFDPQVQFMTDHDVAVAVLTALHEHLPGVFNLGPHDSLPLSQAIRLATKFRVGVNRTVTRAASVVLRTDPWCAELASLMRYGRALDTSRASEVGLGRACCAADAVRGWRDTAREATATVEESWALTRQS